MVALDIVVGAMLVDNPVTELTNLCRRRGLQVTYDFVFENAQGPKRCLLNVSPVSATGAAEEMRRYEAVGQTKKEAKRNVSQRALQELLETEPKKPTVQQSLEDAVLSALSTQVFDTLAKFEHNRGCSIRSCGEIQF